MSKELARKTAEVAVLAGGIGAASVVGVGTAMGLWWLTMAPSGHEEPGAAFSAAAHDQFGRTDAAKPDQPRLVKAGMTPGFK